MHRLEPQGVSDGHGSGVRNGNGRGVSDGHDDVPGGIALLGGSNPERPTAL